MFPQPKFTVGQAVRSPSFVDCFGKTQAEVTGLTVAQTRLIEPTCDTLAPYGAATVTET